LNIPEIILFGPNRVWRTYKGGKILDRMEGKGGSEDSHYPEDWISSTTRAVNQGREEIVEGISEIEFSGQKIALPTFFQRFPNEFLGRDHFRKYGPNTHFLIKYLDSAIRLHIQAHPTIRFSRQHLNSDSGKTEAYIILGTRDEVPEPFIYLGFQRVPEKDLLREIIEKQEIHHLLSYFEKIPVRTGDVFIVPGGLPHAIGEGIFMIEIMEPTDYVVRLEFDRGGYLLPQDSRFMGRDIDFALDMIDFKRVTVEEVRSKYFCAPKPFRQQKGGKEEVLIGPDRTPCFRVHRLTVNDTYFRRGDSFYVGIVTKGNGWVRTRKEERILEKGDRFFIPYNQKEVIFSGNREMEIILTFPPG
jgi:mannose-6-phosphate isomerase